MSGGSKGEGGWTLLEIAVVLFVLGLVLLITYPQLRALSGGDLNTSSRRIVGTIRYLYQESIASRRVLRLNYDLDQERYWITARREDGEFGPPPDILQLPIELPPRIALADVETLQNGKVATGRAFTQFLPEGQVDRTVIHLQDDGGRSRTIVVNPLTGRAKVYDRYVEEKDE